MSGSVGGGGGGVSLAWARSGPRQVKFQCRFLLTGFFSAVSQVRLGRNDTRPAAPGLEDLFYRHGMLSVGRPAVQITNLHSQANAPAPGAIQTSFIKKAAIWPGRRPSGPFANVFPISRSLRLGVRLISLFESWNLLKVLIALVLSSR